MKEQLRSIAARAPIRIHRPVSGKLSHTALRASLLFVVIAVLHASVDVTLTRGQSTTLAITIRSQSDTVLALTPGFIDPNSIDVIIDSTLHLTRSDFTLDLEHVSIRLSRDVLKLLFSRHADEVHVAQISYYQLPITLRHTYALHEIVQSQLPDSLSAQLDSNAQRHPIRQLTAAEEAPSDPFIGRFQKSGSIARGFQVGSNRDLSLTSGFNLQFSGDLGHEVIVEGALTEETTPIQPEGNTQTLHDVDRVFIHATVGEHVSATFGDFVLNLNEHDLGRAFESASTQPSVLAAQPPSPDRNPLLDVANDLAFTNVSRKLLGVEGGVRYGTTAALFSAASARGAYASNTLQGQEAFQGPYQLTGKNGEPVIVVIAGTERVYVDGVLQTRGERNDYIIDYALGQIQFQPRRLITSSSRITVDFQYTSEAYSRSFFAGQLRTALFDSVISFGANYVREGDNPDAPLQTTLSDSDRTILSQAGNDPSHATKSGVTVVPRSSTGAAHGSYLKQDSLINGVHTSVYVYAPLDTLNSIYNITFGFAGSGHGSYARQAIGQYQFVGEGSGDYDTLIYLALPQLTQILDLATTVHPIAPLAVSGEVSGSQFTPNRFAPLAAIGTAYQVRGLFFDSIRIGNSNMGALDLRSSYRQLGSEFRTVDRIDDVDFLRRYGIDLTATTAQLATAHREIRSETMARYAPLAHVQVEAGLGNLDESVIGYIAKRYYGTFTTTQDSVFLPGLFAHLERLTYTDTNRHDAGVWNRLDLTASRRLTIGNFTLSPGIRYARESRNAVTDSTNAVNPTSFSNSAIAPELRLDLLNRVTVTSSYESREEDSARAGALSAVNRSNTIKAGLSLVGISGFSSTLDVTLRRKHYLDSLSLANAGGDQSVLLLRFEPRYSTIDRAFAIDALYEINNQKAARLERVFIPVQAGLGSYQYLGDLNGNGKADPDEFALARYADQGTYVLINVPTTALFPTIDLRSSAHIHFDPSPLLPEKAFTGTLASLLRAVSFESGLRVEETSTDQNENDIYFFRLAHFQNDSTTLRGLTELDEDLFILANDPDKSFRLRFFERRQASQFNTGLERTYTAERSMRARLRIASDVTTESTLSFTTDIAVTPDASYNRPHSTTGASFVSDVSYHPSFSSFDYGLHLEGLLTTERTLVPNVDAATTVIGPRIGWALESRTRLRLELERDELELANAPSDALLLPYSLTSGRTVGITWLWKLALDYNLGSGILATLSYDGRNVADPITGSRLTVHNARAEIRASF